MTVKLNKNRQGYINYNLSDKYEALKLILMEFGKQKSLAFLEVNKEIANEIRDWAGNELQIRRFDINYELTRESKIL